MLNPAEPPCVPVALFLIILGTPILFSIEADHLTFPPAGHKGSVFFTSHQHVWFSVVLVVVTRMVLIFVSLMFGDFEHLFIFLCVLANSFFGDRSF